MVKSQIKLLIVFLLSSFLISFNAQAHHKENALFKTIPWDKDKFEKKRDAQNAAKQKYCAVSAKARQIKTKLETEEGEVATEAFKVEHITEIEGYHQTKATKIKDYLPLKNKKLDFSFSKKNTLLEVLQTYCVQLKSLDKPIKFKGEYLEDFYMRIAEENKFVDEKDDETRVANYNLKLTEGLLGSSIMKIGISVSDPDAVFYYPDFLIKPLEESIKKDERRKSDEDWLNKHKQPLITKMEEKLTEYDKKTEKLEKDRSNIGSLLATYKTDIEKAKERVEEVFDDVDMSQNEIKVKKKEIRADAKKYLKVDDLERFTSSYKELKKIKFKKYESYKKLSALIVKTKKSNKRKDFEDNKKKGKRGFIGKFEDLKDKELGSKRDEKTMERLSSDIKKEINNLQTYIYGPIQDLEDLDTELSSRIPIVKYAIYLVIFLIVIAVIIYIYFQSRKISSLSKETETAGKKFSDIEGKLRDTSERIKTVGRQGRGRPTTDATPDPVKEKHKTPEQIITDKFHDMVSDYNEAIDNFSNVAAFKQKWNGVALSRKERQDGTKTVLINSSRAFEKSEIWCVNFSDKYFAFPGSTVKSNMAAYMNLDFEKASRDFKGVFDISSGSNWGTEPSIVRRGGAGFVVERKGKLIFPS